MMEVLVILSGYLGVIPLLASVCLLNIFNVTMSSSTAIMTTSTKRMVKALEESLKQESIQIAKAGALAICGCSVLFLIVLVSLNY
jgi:hypothetical protein